MTSIINYCTIDEGRRYLITDNYGRVYVLILNQDKPNESPSMKVI